MLETTGSASGSFHVGEDCQGNLVNKDDIVWQLPFGENFRAVFQNQFFGNVRPISKDNQSNGPFIPLWVLLRNYGGLHDIVKGNNMVLKIDWLIIYSRSKALRRMFSV